MDTERPKDLAGLVKLYMAEAGMPSGHQLALDADVSQPHISRILIGRNFPKPKIAIRLMKVLKVPPEYEAEFLLYAARYNPRLVERVLKNHR